MPIADLLELVVKLKGRIESHGPALRQNEALTRYPLIDPLLRALGWDTEDPAVVIPEYTAGKGQKADYALLQMPSETTTGDSHPAKAAVIVEAKSLDTPLGEEVVQQGIRYSVEQGIEYFAVTDGRRWTIYEPLRPVPIAEKIVVSFDLKEASTAEVCRKALALWRPGAAANEVTPSSSAVVTRTGGRVEGVPLTAHPPELPGPPESVWQALRDLKPVGKKSKPVEIRFPNGNREPIKAWRHVLVAVVRWLVDSNYLNEDKCPIPIKEGSDRYSVSVAPEHARGAQFMAPVKVVPLFVDAHGSAIALISRSNLIIERVGQQSSEFMVRFPL